MPPYAVFYLGFTVCQSTCLPVSRMKRVNMKMSTDATKPLKCYYYLPELCKLLARHGEHKSFIPSGPACLRQVLALLWWVAPKLVLQGLV